MDNIPSRKDDLPSSDASKHPKQFFRASDRIFCLNGEWFFQAREREHGPFTRREAAEQALERFIGERADPEASSLAGLRVIPYYDLDESVTA